MTGLQLKPITKSHLAETFYFSETEVKFQNISKFFIPKHSQNCGKSVPLFRGQITTMDAKIVIIPGYS